MIDELREKIAKIICEDCINLSEAYGGFNFANKILVLPELQALIESAAKWEKVKKVWDEECKMEGDELGMEPWCFKLKKQLEGWEVEEKCPECEKIHKATDCMVCFGTGTIRRPLTIKDLISFAAAKRGKVKEEKCSYCVNGFCFDTTGSGMCDVICPICQGTGRKRK